MLLVFFRALILFIVVFLAIRIMGKSELSKVQPFELTIIILIADLASVPMSSRGISIIDGVIPIITLLIAYIVINLIIRINSKTQEVICGTISVLIKNGIADEQELKKQHYTLPDLMEQLREKDVFKIQDVKYAILETNGDLNVIKNEDNFSSIPLNIIENGEAVPKNLEILGISDSDLEKIVAKEKIKVEDVYVGTYDENKNFIYQLKEEVN